MTQPTGSDPNEGPAYGQPQTGQPQYGQPPSNQPQYGTPPPDQPPSGPPLPPPSAYQNQPGNQSGNQPPNYQGQPGYQGQAPDQGQQWRPPSPNGPALSEADQKQWAMIAHLGGVLAIVPLLALLPSLLIYAIYGSRGEFLKDQAREALNFQITVLIVYVIARILSALPPFPSLVLLVWAFSLVFSIIGAMAANRGQRYRYPLTFRFIN